MEERCAFNNTQIAYMHQRKAITKANYNKDDFKLCVCNSFSLSMHAPVSMAGHAICVQGDVKWKEDIQTRAV